MEMLNGIRKKDNLVVSIHQPSYFPWLGLLDKIAKSDIFILLDEVQLMDRGFQHRNIFLDSQGRIKYLTIPILKKGYREKKIRDILINPYENWKRKHKNFLFFNYSNHPFFKEIYPKLEEFFSKNFKYLIDALYESMKIVMCFLGIKTTILFQSQLKYDRSKMKAELILELLKVIKYEFQKDVVYLSGEGAKVYMMPHLLQFEKEGIKVIWNKFKHPVYPQKNSSKFVEGLSSLDFLFNMGIKKGKEIFWNNIKGEIK